MTHDNIVADKSVDFAIRITNCYKYLVREKREDIMSKQLFRSGTSIGANIHEGIQGQSRADFVSKLNIALKEASETSDWLVVLHKPKWVIKKQITIIKIILSTNYHNYRN